MTCPLVQLPMLNKIPLLEAIFVLQTLDPFLKKNKAVLYCTSLVRVHSPDWLSRPVRSKTVNRTSPRICWILQIVQTVSNHSDESHRLQLFMYDPLALNGEGTAFFKKRSIASGCGYIVK